MLEEIARNKRRSVLVILGFVLIWVGIGALLGALFGGSSGSRGSAVATGIVIAAIVALLASAYAMSHIRNYDVRLILVVSTLIGLAGLLASMVWRSAFFMRPRGRDAQQITILILAAGVLLTVVAFVVGPLIRFALSRSREELAD